MEHRIGYACMNMDTEPNSFKTFRIKDYTEAKFLECVEHNLDVLEAMIDYNIAQGNTFYRLSSSLIPFASHAVQIVDWKEHFEARIFKIRKKIEMGRIRITCHPGQYTVLNSPREDVIDRALLDLEYHADLMDVFGDQESVIILHIGGIYDDKKQAIERFIETSTTRLSDRVRSYLILENDDRLYHVEDVLYIAERVGLPMVFDNLHHECNPSMQNIEISEMMRKVQNTWNTSQKKMKVHYSQQDPGKRIGAHTETIYLDQFIQDFETYYAALDCDIMLEVKDKNRSFIKVNLWMHPDARVLEKEWAKTKYLLMAKSYKAYQDIRTLFKHAPVDVQEFYRIIDTISLQDDDPKQQYNAYQHMWGYFKTCATDKEKEKFLLMSQEFKDTKIEAIVVLRYLKKLAKKYQVTYLLDSYILNF